MSDDLTGLPLAPTDDGSSLEDHESAFGPGGTGELPDPTDIPTVEPPAAESTPEQKAAERDEQGRFQKTPRHRAKSQQASPADVPRINELTAKLRAAEARADEAERRARAPQPPAPSPQPQDSRPQQPPAKPWQPPPTRPKPTEDEVGTEKYPKHEDFVEDLADWVAEQREVRREVRLATETHQKTQQDRITAHTARVATFKAAHPDYEAVVTAIDQTHAPSEVMKDAILSSERSVDLVYWLATHPTEYQQLIHDSLAVNHPAAINLVRSVLESRLPVVASAQRSSREAAGVTGAAPTLAIVPAPRPPTPVRTGPLKSGDEPPDDEDGLDAHEAHYYRKSR